MEERNSYLVSFVIVALLVAFILITQTCSMAASRRVYNNGIHKNCGGHWVYESAVGHYYSTNYIYHCDKCGTVHEFKEKY